ncbi:hypothetical protein [Yinghuangia sp. YIM S09857]|uniref:hypothetical protein n=1 Tax=Yinghuangia sp. YIM S09857 TaxID=3436929 RepID=UPI003F53947C
MDNVWDVAPRTDRGEVADAAEATGAEHAGVEQLAGAEVEAEAEPEPTPLGLDAPEPSGDASVDRAVRRLTQVDVLPTELHGEVYEDVHRELREVLAGLDR